MYFKLCFFFPLQVPEPVVSTPEVKEEPAPPAPTPTKEEPAPVSAPPKPELTSPPPSVPVEKDQSAEVLKNHEPHLGPKPRSHNRVLNPPGGKSSVVFYWRARMPRLLIYAHTPPFSAPPLIFAHSNSTLLTVSQARIFFPSFHQTQDQMHSCTFSLSPD